MQKEKDLQKARKIIVWLKFGLLLAILILVPLAIYFNYHDLLENLGSMEKMNAFLSRHQTESAFIYLGLQIAQIVICILPGQALQFAAGYVFHFWIGTVLTLLGAATGTVVTFYIARILGKDAMYLIFGEAKLNRYIEKLNSKRAFILIFVIYLIPGLPKDIFAYAIGVSNMRFTPFFIVSMIGRTPAMLGSIIMGVMFRTGSYAAAGGLLAVAVIFCIVGIFEHKKLHAWLDRQYLKLIK